MRVFRLPTRGLLTIVAIAFVTGCAGTTTPPPGSMSSAAWSDGEYVIGPADQLEIRVWKNPELSVVVPVRPDGKISVPLLDDVHAAGLTATELKELLTREMAEYIANPDITVVVAQTLSKRAYVLGEVLRSGPVSLATDMRLTDAIASAGGFGPFADKKRVRVIRRSEDGDVDYRFNYDAYIRGKAPGTNLVVEPGDTIVVPD